MIDVARSFCLFFNFLKNITIKLNPANLQLTIAILKGYLPGKNKITDQTHISARVLV